MIGSTTLTSAERRAGVMSPAGELRVVRELVTALETAGLTYCHWKGNVRLAEAVSGRSDLDILVDRAQAVPLQSILAAVGFRRFESSPWAGFPAVADYLALDRDTGRLAHLHLHYRLTVGESHLSGYRLPWEGLVLSTRRYDADAAMYLADPQVELLLLVVRAALRHGLIRRVSGWLGGSPTSAQMGSDLRWLVTRSNPHRLVELSEQLVGTAASLVLAEMVAGEPSYRRLGAFKRRVSPPLGAYRSYSWGGATVRRGIRGFYGAMLGINRKVLRSLVLPGRTRPNGGLVVAFEGDDRPRRSALVSQLAAWLTWKLDVVVLTLEKGGRDRAHGLSALLRGRDDRAKRTKASRARGRGMIVLCDGMPWTSGGSPPASRPPGFGRLLRAVGRWEQAPLEAWENDPADLVVSLRSPPPIGSEVESPTRGGGEPPAVAGVRPISRRVYIDPGLPPEQMLVEAQRALWGMM